MSSEWQAYLKDSRTICKYGEKCYQKNPEHRKTYKHPPVNTKRKGGSNSPANKRYKPSPKQATGEKDRHQTTHEKDDLKTEEVSTNNQATEVDLASSSHIETKVEELQLSLPEKISFHDNTDHALLKELFLVDMPKDFHQFFKYVDDEGDYQKLLASVNLELIGPFELLMGKLPVLDERDLYLIHWRFFYDPPEFQAVLKKKGKSEYHIGYFRDEPNSHPVFLASNDSTKGCHITPVAENIFAAVYLFLQNEKKSSPFTSVACQKLMEKVKNWAESHAYSLDEYNSRKRLAQAVTKTFHGAGIVVPYNKKTEMGYRKLVETDANLKKLFTKLESAKSQNEKDKILSELQPVITYASIAVDECDFGTGLEAGIDLFCSGIKELQQSALSSLQAVYSLLNRAEFGKIIQVHLKYRRKGPDMSVLSANKS